MNPQSAIRNPQSLHPATEIFVAYLRMHCVGREAARPKWRVLQDLVRAGVHVANRDYDDLPRAALDLGYDVGTWRKGAYLIVDQADFDAALGNLSARFGPMRDHHQALLARRRKRFPDEPLFDEETT